MKRIVIMLLYLSAIAMPAAYAQGQPAHSSAGSTQPAAYGLAPETGNAGPAAATQQPTAAGDKQPDCD